MKINWHIVTGYLMVMVASSFWGGSATLGKTLMQRGLPTVMLMEVRSILSAGFLVAALCIFARKHLRISAADLPGLILLAIPGLALVNASYYYAVKLLPIAVAVFIQFTAPMLIFVYGIATRTERPTGSKLTALVLSIAGTYLMVQLQNKPIGGLPWIGLASAVLSMITYAFYVLVSKRLGQKHSSWTLVAYGYGIASIFWCVVQNPVHTFGVLTAKGLWPLAGLFALVSTLIPFSLFLLGLRRISPTGASIVSTAETVTATGFAFLFLGETLTLWQVIGAAFILAASLILILKSSRMPVLVED